MKMERLLLKQANKYKKTAYTKKRVGVFYLSVFSRETNKTVYINVGYKLKR